MHYEFGDYTVMVIGNKLLIQKDMEDGKFEKRIYRVDEAKAGFMWDILKTKVKFCNGAEGLQRWLEHMAQDDSHHGLEISFLNKVWECVKQCKA